MEKCVIVEYGRSGIAKARKGSLAKVNPIDFGAQVLRGVLDKLPTLDLNCVDDLILGCAIPEGKMGLNPARNLVIRAGLPNSVPGQTVNRFCSSSLQALAIGAAMINSGMQDVVIAGGIESMSEPVLSEQKEFLNEWLLENTEAYVSMGQTGENVARKYNLTREELDKFSLLSNQKAIEALKNDEFKDQIIAVDGFDKEGKAYKFAKDECIRVNTNLESLISLKPCFAQDGILTAGSSSQMSDGASFVVLMSERKAKELNIKPVAEFLAFAVSGLEPEFMGLGPISASLKLLNKLSLSVDDLDVVEINEAFASQALVSIEELGLDMAKVNPYGGAIAMGHPLGATGTILVCKALHYLEKNKKDLGLITMCIGGGMGAAGLVKMYN